MKKAKSFCITTGIFSVIGIVCSLLNFLLNKRGISSINTVSGAQCEFVAIKVGNNTWIYFITLVILLLFIVSFCMYIREKGRLNDKE